MATMATWQNVVPGAAGCNPKESRPPTYHQLKLQLWWIPRDSTGGQDTAVERHRSFFQEQALLVDIDATFWISNGRTKPVKKLNEGSISQIHVTIEWPVVAWLGAPAKYLQGHIENRILELFNGEFVIRAPFWDDNMENVSFTLNLHSSWDAVPDAVIGCFLRVGSREFKFLAPSTSQLRDHGTWMYTMDEHQNSAVIIRKWMGHFEDIPNVAKRLARMGQCFSSTEQSVRVQRCHVQLVPDVVGDVHPISKKPYIFSDGVGMMFVQLAEEVYKVLNLKDRPSAIQIRYAGAKGKLCVNPALPDKKLLWLRPSMQKFPCFNSEFLEVVKVSAPRSLTLSRPLITLFEQLGVPKDTIVYLQERMILEFTHALVNESSAVEVLTAWSKLKLPFKELSEAGFQLTLDPFFRSLLLGVYRNAVAGLRYKTRMALPVDRARNMLGVVDTTGRLRYGEVFLQCTEICSPQVQQQGPTKVTVSEGTVLVTKCPCLYPGDMRKFTAVNVPQLHYVVDCIVFSAQGPWPHSDKMAGSDLDGDEYVVILEKCLFFPGPNRTPMNFSDRNPEPDQKEITNGKIAYLKRDGRPHLYPDFMEKGSHKTTYRSDRALGVLYCTCRSLEAAVGNLGHRHVDPGRCQALAVPGWEGYRESVLQALAEYNANLRRILNQYGIGTEGEVMACMVNTFDTYHNAQSDKLNMEDLVEKMTTFLTVTTMDIFYADCLKEKHSSHTSDREELRKRKLRRASACYMATYESSTENSFFSFPWCITEVLNEILRSTGTQDRVWCPNILCWKITQFVENSDLEEDDGLAARCDTFKTAFGIIEEWLVKETLLGKHQPGAASMPGLCYNGLLGIYSEFLRSRKLAPLGKIVARKRHIMMVSATPEAKGETAHEPVTEALNNLCVGRQNSTKKAPSEAWQIVDGVVEPHYLDDSEDENDSPDMADQGGRGNNHEQDLQVFPLHQPPDARNLETDLGEDTSVGTLVVSFLRWCLEQHRLPQEACRVCACAGGGCDCQTHRWPMVALLAYSSLAVSLDPCHISLPCDPAYQEPHQEVIERDPVQIMVPNPAMDLMLKETLDAVRACVFQL
ncbi:hypothetical protein HPB50_028387 [Hyalomma asiaticum]|nr:hypothetical protein HPB50_028387 [Hyalomma asiaticum]